MNNKMISFKGKLGIGLAGGANAIGLYFNLILVMMFLTDVVGISPAVVGMMLLITRVIDAINDPICGVLIDKSSYKGIKSGRWIVYGAVIMSLSMALLYYVPDLSPKGKTLWSFITYILFGGAYTANVLGVMTLMARVTNDNIEKVSISSWNQAGYSIIGGLFSMIGMPFINNIAGGNIKLGYFFFAILSSIFIIIFSIYCDKHNVEKVLPAYDYQTNKSLKDTRRNLTKNKSFWIMLMIFMLLSTGSGMSASALLYYIEYNLARTDLFPVLMPMAYIGGILACVLAKPFVKLIGKHRSLQAMLGFSVIAYGLRWISNDSSISLMIGLSLVFSVASSLYLLLSMPMLMDIVDYGEYLTGDRDDAVIMSASTFSQKFGMGVSAAILGFILEFNGYVANAPKQTAKALEAIFQCTVTIPTILFFIAFCLMFAYKLTDERMIEIQQKLEERIKYPKAM